MQFDFLAVLVVFVFKFVVVHLWLYKKAKCIYLCLHLDWKSWGLEFLWARIR